MEKPAGHRGLVLLVDDVEDNRDMYAQHLRFVGFQVIEASSGTEAIALAMEQQPAVIVTDLSMPGLDGWETCRWLKSDIGTGHIPVIALTAHVFTDAQTRALRAGCDAYLTKPCLPEALIAEIEEVARRGARPPRSRSARAS